jgi:hypothetical protein
MATERKFNRYPDGFEITDKRGQDENYGDSTFTAEASEKGITLSVSKCYGRDRDNYDDTRDHEFLLDEENLIELAMLIETWKEKYATPS